MELNWLYREVNLVQSLSGLSPISRWNNSNPSKYKEDIIKFFLKYPTELDALLFSNKKHPSNTTILWYEWIYKQLEHRDVSRAQGGAQCLKSKYLRVPTM